MRPPINHIHWLCKPHEDGRLSIGWFRMGRHVVILLATWKWEKMIRL